MVGTAWKTFGEQSGCFVFGERRITASILTNSPEFALLFLGLCSTTRWRVGPFSSTPFVGPFMCILIGSSYLDAVWGPVFFIFVFN